MKKFSLRNVSDIISEKELKKVTGGYLELVRCTYCYSDGGCESSICLEVWAGMAWCAARSGQDPGQGSCACSYNCT